MIAGLPDAPGRKVRGANAARCWCVAGPDAARASQQGDPDEEPRARSARCRCPRRLHRRTGLRAPRRRRADRLANRLPEGRRRREHEVVGAVRRPGAQRPDRDGVARESRRANRRRARRPVHRRPRFVALPVVSPDRLRRGRHPRQVQPGRPAAASRRRRPLFHAVPGVARRVVAARPVRPGPSPERSGAGAGLRERAGAARGRAVGGQRRRDRATSRCARSTGSSRSPRGRRRTSARRRASSTCASRPASCRRRKSSRSARSTSRRWPRFRPSSCRSRRRRT